MMDEMPRNISVLIVLFLVAFSSLTWGKVDPSSGFIRIICIGESYYPETRFPLLLSADPRIRYQPIPANWYEGSFASVGAGREDALKFIRQYMPRTYDRLIDAYDVILLSDFEVDIITEQQFDWMERSVREDGFGLGKYEMNYDTSHFSTFGRFIASAVYPAFPADLQSGSTIPGTSEGIYAVQLGTGKVHPVLDLPGMRNYKILSSGTYGYEIPRQGATTIAKFVLKDVDAMIIWDYGKGRSLTCLPGLDKIDSTAVAQWPYAVDFWINQMWYLADLDIPEELELVHTLRSDSLTYINERSLATSVIEFVEKFGASTLKLYDQLGEVDDIKKESDHLYMEERYHDSLDKLQEAYAGLREVAENSVKVKEAALLWIYIVEWFAVTGTAILTGFIVWTLMVRRRLYREVSVTRAR